ncbi:hypothetical protein [Pleomorphochaeta sp. DL1XJH-081]|uniref:hypothetical protein n=1 Tax=Pleomorphochaeta sp. DL1XJH-081 TaxID=3409690 RepID=UPI003BB5D9CC
MVDNKEFMRILEEAYWWKVDSYTEYDEHAIAIELVMMQVIDTSAIALADGFPPRREIGRYRLYRITSGSKQLPEKEASTEEFAKRCKAESEQLGYPVMVTWRDGRPRSHPMDWYSVVQKEGNSFFLRSWDGKIFDTVKAFALAFNREHMGAWEYLLKDNRWHYEDEEISYHYNYSGKGVPDKLDLSLQLVQKHTSIGKVTAGLCRQEGQIYVPCVMNNETGKGFFFRVPYETVIEITARDIPKGAPFTPFQQLQAIEKLVPKIVYDLEGWKIHSSEDLVIDVDVKSTTTGKIPIRNRYRLPIGYYKKRLSTEDSSVLIFQALDSNTSEALREEKMDLVFDLERVDRFWSESIFTHPWINAYGHLEFLNGASFAPSWIVHRGMLVAVLKSD